MVIYDEAENGIITRVHAMENWVSLYCGDKRDHDTITLTRDEAIAAARAILAHYKEPV